MITISEFIMKNTRIKIPRCPKCVKAYIKEAKTSIETKSMELMTESEKSKMFGMPATKFLLSSKDEKKGLINIIFVCDECDREKAIKQPLSDIEFRKILNLPPEAGKIAKITDFIDDDLDDDI